jgi:hypothetical protein
LAAILNFSCQNGFFYKSLVLFENKTVRNLKKICTVDLLQFFKKRSTEIRHLGSRRHFGLFQKMFFHDLFVFKG